MATSSSKTTTRKSSTTRASSSTSTSKSAADPEVTPDPTTGEPPADTAADTSAETPAESPPSSDAASDDPAAALKAKLRTTQHVENTRPDDLTDEQRLNLVGAPASALPGPRTLATRTAPVRTGEEYVTVESDGYVATIPDRAQQPATVRVWVEGQRVRKDMHDALSGIAATDAKDAPVLTGDDYVKVAPYL